MIIHNLVKKEDGQICLGASLASRAQPVKIEPVADDLVTRRLGDLLDETLRQTNLWVQNFLAIDADKMRMGIWLVAIVAVVAITEAQFQYFIDFFQDIQGFVNRRQARRRKLILDLLVQLGGAGMSIAGSQQPQQRDALWRQPIFTLLELVHQFFKPGLWIHRTAFSVKP